MPRKGRDAAARRRILIRLLLELHALIRDSKVPYEEAIVAVTIRLGQYEGRLMDVSDISRITGLPLSSVSRHLKAQRKKGRVRSVKTGRRTVQYFPPTPEAPEVTRFYAQLEDAVTRAFHDVSILETSTVDKPVR
jgi:DNA-binding transcriptional ArsR family regulator